MTVLKSTHQDRPTLARHAPHYADNPTAGALGTLEASGKQHKCIKCLCKQCELTVSSTKTMGMAHLTGHGRYQTLGNEQWKMSNGQWRWANPNGHGGHWLRGQWAMPRLAHASVFVWSPSHLPRTMTN